MKKSASTACGASLIEQVRAVLAQSVAAPLVHELLEAYVEAKRSALLGGHRLSEVEAGRFCEAAYRILQEITTGHYDSLDQPIRTEDVTRQLANHRVGSFPASVRLHIPRALRVVYDIRSHRDAAHLANGVDPNPQDATLVVSILDWVLAEFVRLLHHVAPAEAQAMINGIVTRAIPVVERFDDALKVLNPKLRAGDHCLVLLYHRAREGATHDELHSWARANMRANLRRTLDRLEHELALVHYNGERYRITLAGKAEVERRGLAEF